MQIHTYIYRERERERERETERERERQRQRQRERDMPGRTLLKCQQRLAPVFLKTLTFLFVFF